MKKDKVLYFAPRILTVLFILFISLFALDVFSMEGSFIEKIGGFLIHLIPSYILTFALIVAWKKEKIGGFLFILLFIFAIFFFGGPAESFWLFSPLILIAALFFAHAFLTKNMD